MPDASTPPAAISQRLYWTAALALLALHATFAWLLRAPIISPDANDYGHYLMLARALEHFNYRDLHLLGAPFEGQYPPVYPLLIAATGASTAGDLVSIQVMTILCSVLALFFLADTARRLAGPAAGLAILLALVPNTFFVTFAGRVLAEQTFLMFSAGALWAAVAFEGTRARLVGVTVFAILAALSRSTGIALVGAVGLLWLLERRWRAVAGYAVAAGATVFAWLAWTALLPDKIAARSYVSALGRVNKKLDLFTVFERRILHTVQTYSRTILTGLEVPSIPNTSLDNVVALLLVIGLAITGLVGLWRRGHRLPALYVVCYLTMLTVYPWKVGRFLIPLLPVLLLAALVAVDRLTRRRSPLWAVAGCALLVLPSSLHSLSLLAAKIPAAQACRGVDVVRTEGCMSPTARAYMEATRFAADSLPRDAVVLTVKEAVFHLHTGLLTFHPGRVRGKSGAEMFDFMRETGVRYLLLSNYPDGNTIAPAIGTECSQLDLLMEAAPETYLFRLRPAGVAAGSPAACQAVASSSAMFEQRRRTEDTTEDVSPEGGDR